MLGIEVLNEDEGHSRVWGNMTDKFGESFETAGGSANGDDQEIVIGSRALRVDLRFSGLVLGFIVNS